MRRLLTMTVVVMLVIVMLPATAAGEKPLQYFVDEAKLPFTALPGATASWGVLDRAGFRIEVPGAWNGSLVMWAHGFAGSGLELTVDNHPLREWLIGNGYAWAASSYSKNDYNVAQGVKDTHALAAHFAESMAEPVRVYMTGASMGGHIAAVSIEQYPQAYDGAMPVCGVLGDFEVFDFYLDFNVTAQQLALGTSEFPVSDPLVYAGVTAQQIKANLELVPGGWPVLLNPTGEQFKQLVELRSGGDRPNFDEAWFFWNSFPEFGSGIPGNFLFDLGTLDGTLPGKPGIAVDNTDVFYQLDLDPATSLAEQALNDTVVRVEADQSARNPNGLANVPAISGDIPVPVLTLHNLGDLFVPFHNEVIYAGEVASHGKSDLLVQRAIRGVGHCDFTGFELVTGFAELVAWVEFGVKPAGDDFLDPAAVAAPDFGCAFTDFVGPPAHTFPTPCP